VKEEEEEARECEECHSFRSFVRRPNDEAVGYFRITSLLMPFKNEEVLFRRAAR